MGKDLSILKKGLLLVALPLVFQVVFIALLSKTINEGTRAQHWAIHTKEVIAQVEGTYRKMVEAHSGVRGLILTGDEGFRNDHDKAIESVPRELVGLQALVEDNPPQQAKARRIASRAEALLRWEEAVCGLVQKGRRDEAVGRIKDQSGKRLLEELRAAIDDFLTEEVRLDARRLRALASSRRQQMVFLAAGGVAAFLGTLALAFLFSRGISERIQLLTENVERLAEGKELTQPLEGQDEIARLDAVFHDMARAILEKNRENELFIYSVSHDLRSPLVNLQGFSQELAIARKELRGIFEAADLPVPLRDRARGLIDEDMEDSTQFIQTAVSRLSVIIDALLRLSRAGRVEYRWQPVDVRATVARVVDALGVSRSQQHAKVTVGELPVAWGDPTAIEQVFANLIGNAMNYLDPSRPGVIEVGSVPGTGSPAAPLQTYYVKDNGLGIPESCKPKLFLAFQRFHQASAKGEGIGLALVRRIVDRHGGRIWFESESGVGSTFYIALPAGPPEGARNGAFFEKSQGRESRP